MTKPKYLAETIQEQIDCGLNGFAVQMVAESYAHDPARFADATVMAVGTSRKGVRVYMLISTVAPTIQQLAGWPE